MNNFAFDLFEFLPCIQPNWWELCLTSLLLHYMVPVCFWRLIPHSPQKVEDHLQFWGVNFKKSQLSQLAKLIHQTPWSRWPLLRHCFQSRRECMCILVLLCIHMMIQQIGPRLHPNGMILRLGFFVVVVQMVSSTCEADSLCLSSINLWRQQHGHSSASNSHAPYLIIICPLNLRVVGALQMISKPISSIFPCSPLPSGTWGTPGLSIPWWCLPTSSSVCPFTVPFKMVLAGPDERETWPYLYCTLRLFTVVRRSSCGPIACWILALTSSLVTRSL